MAEESLQESKRKKRRETVKLFHRSVAQLGGTSETEVTKLLAKAAEGDVQAKETLFNVLYPTLRELAAAHMNRERSDHTLQPTALVNEAAAKLLKGKLLRHATDRASFLATASSAMRAILVDHARKRSAAKRPTGKLGDRVPLENVLECFEREQGLDVEALDEAMQQLNSFSPRQHEIVMLHFFGGLTFREIASHLGVSLSTVEKDWKFARAWLRKTMDRPT